MVMNKIIEATRGAVAPVYDCKRDIYPGFDSYSRKCNICIFFALVLAKFDGKWGTVYLNNRFPLPTLLHAGYSEKFKKYIKNIIRNTFGIFNGISSDINCFITIIHVAIINVFLTKGFDIKNSINGEFIHFHM